jgi:hypothetical protein
MFYFCIFSIKLDLFEATCYITDKSFLQALNNLPRSVCIEQTIFSFLQPLIAWVRNLKCGNLILGKPIAVNAPTHWYLLAVRIIQGSLTETESSVLLTSAIR